MASTDKEWPEVLLIKTSGQSLSYLLNNLQILDTLYSLIKSKFYLYIFLYYTKNKEDS